MNSLNKIWNRIEKPVIYVTLAIFLFLRLVSIIFNFKPIDNLMKSEGIYLFTAIILFYLFLFIDRRLPSQQQCQGLTHFSNLHEAMNYIFSRCGKTVTIDLFAHSSQAFYQYIRAIVSRIEKLQVVIRDPNSVNFLPHLHDGSSRNSERQKIGITAQNWVELKKSGIAYEVKLFYYDFEPSFYYVNVNNSMVLLGILEATQEHWGYAVKSCIVVDGKNDTGALFMNDLVRWYEALIKEKCTEHTNTKLTN